MRSRGYCEDGKYQLLVHYFSIFSSCLYFLFILLVYDFLTFFLICFIAIEQPKLEERYQGRIEAALEFALTFSFEDFKGLVGDRRL